MQIARVLFKTVVSDFRSHFASSTSPIRQDERSVLPTEFPGALSPIHGGQISHKITEDEDSGPFQSPRGNIFSVRASRHIVETAERGEGKSPFVRR